MRPTPLTEKDSIILDYILKIKKLSINSSDYSEKTKKSLLNSHEGLCGRFIRWYEVNKNNADALKVSMRDYIAVMSNLDEAMSDFTSIENLSGIYEEINVECNVHILFRLKQDTCWRK